MLSLTPQRWPRRQRLRGALSVTIAGLFAVVSLLPGLAMPAQAASPRVPILWGAYLDGAPWNMSVVSSFEADAGKGVSILEFGEPWYHEGAYQNFPINEVTTIRGHGSIPLITWGSWDYALGLNQSDFTLAAITAGKHDAYLQQWAAAAAAWGHPLFLRFDPEMNGGWEEWSEQANGNQPGDFVKMWRHVRGIFAQAKATNVSFVWCPNIEGTTSTPLKELYPGNSYVDWTGLDGYNWGTDENNGWETFAQVFSGTPSYGNFNSYRDVQNLAPTKPMMIAEIASAEDGGSKAAWIKDMLQTQLPSNYPSFRAFVWFNYHYDSPGAPNWPIESSPSATAAFKKGIASSYFMANTFGSLGGSGTSGKSSASSPMAGSALSTPAAGTAPAGSDPGSSAANSAAQTNAMLAAKMAYLSTHS